MNAQVNTKTETKPGQTKAFSTKAEAYHKKGLTKLLEEFKTKSALIRKMHAEGIETGEISRATGIRYQHVRNVLITPVSAQTKKAG
jgi:hypothetical protein